MRLLLALTLLLAWPATLVRAHDVDPPNPTVRLHFLEMLKCRGDTEVDRASSENACKKRDELARELERAGYCYDTNGPDDDGEPHWHFCRKVVDRAGATDDYSNFRYSGWWVVVGSFEDATQSKISVHDDMRRRIGRCGFKPFNDFSSKFSGFKPGYQVYVLGAYETEAEAKAIREAVKQCAPGVYLKEGRYAGE